MCALLYREDVDEAYDRLTTWWQGGDIGRPVMLITAKRKAPLEPIPVMAEPAGWITRYSTSNFAYRVNLAARACINTHYWGEAIPQIAPDLGPNCLALYLGCQGVDGIDTVWFEPGEKHWHGAAPLTAMTHIAMQEAKDGRAVDWLEPVSDEQYGA